MLLPRFHIHEPIDLFDGRYFTLRVKHILQRAFADPDNDNAKADRGAVTVTALAFALLAEEDARVVQAMRALGVTTATLRKELNKGTDQ